MVEKLVAEGGEGDEPKPESAPSAGEMEAKGNDSPSEDTIFGEENAGLAHLAEIDFGVLETGRWLLKVVNGPNNGAEFYLQADHQYTLGMDPKSCDIVFHDTSVSRQHAKIAITPEDTLTIEDLKSRNGVLIAGAAIEGRQPLSANTLVTLGTTSFIIYDLEGEMQTIISPLLPAIVKVLQGEPPGKSDMPATPPIGDEPAAPSPAPMPAPPPPAEAPAPPKRPRSLGPYIILAAVIGLFALAGMGTSALFKSEPVVVQTQENADELIRQTLKPFPAVRYTFNRTTGSLLLLGHVASVSEKNQLLYNLHELPFIKSSPDDTELVIDEYVWREFNSIASDNPAWRGIAIYSPTAGEFVLSGYLRTRQQADQLSSYISLNFPYLDLLKKQIVVEEDVLNQINALLQNAKLPDVVPKMNNGEIALTGTAPSDKMEAVAQIVQKIKQIPGVRIVNSLVRVQTTETGIVDLSDAYPVTGHSRIGNKYTVVIHGHILSENDDLEGMTITKITPDRVLLEKGDVKYRINY